MREKIENSNIPKVFISYSWSSPDHEDWVSKLAEKLTSDGVSVVFDKWDLKYGHDLFHFAEKIVADKEIQKVLVICDKIYQEKANKRIRGAGAESQLISGEIYGKASQERFIPIIKEYDNEGQPCLPFFMKSRLYIDLSDEKQFEKQYEELIRNIYNKPTFLRPSLGTKPDYLNSDEVVKTIHSRKNKTTSSTNSTLQPIDKMQNINLKKNNLPEFLLALKHRNKKSNMQLMLGSDSAGEYFLSDLKKMPYLLITGLDDNNAKSACINTIILSLLYQNTPNSMGLILVDLDRSRLMPYSTVPHLLVEMITEKNIAIKTLDWVTREMNNRFGIIQKFGSGNAESYNKKVENNEKFKHVNDETGEIMEEYSDNGKISNLVVIINEIGKLIDSSFFASSDDQSEFEKKIIHLTNWGSLVGIHFIFLSSSRWFLNTGKMNLDFFARIETKTLFEVRTDNSGVTKNLEYDEVIFSLTKKHYPQIIKTIFVSDDEIEDAVNFLKLC